jgi:hypothetical protein
MWINARSKLPLEGHAETPRGWKCLIRLVNAMEKELGMKNIQYEYSKDRQLKKQILKVLGGGNVSFQAALVNSNRPSGWLFRRAGEWAVKRFKIDRWWYASMVLSLVITLTPFIAKKGFMSHVAYYMGLVLSGISMSILTAILLGDRAKGRLFIGFCSFALLLLLVAIPLYATGRLAPA